MGDPMSTAVLFKNEEPSVQVSGGVLYIDGFVESDPTVVKVVDESDDALTELHRLLVLGAHVSTVTDSSKKALDLSETVSRLTSSVEETVDEAVDDIAEATKNLLDADDGELPKLLAQFRGQFESMLGENFDPNSKKSLVTKFETVMQNAVEEQSRRLTRALDPHAPDSLAGRLKDDVVKTVKDEAAIIANQLGQLREVVTSAAAASQASKAVFDKTTLKGTKFEDVLHELVNGEAVHFGDVATQVRNELGILGTKDGDEVVSVNIEDTRGVNVKVVWEAKTKKVGLKSILEELGDAIANRAASAGIAVFGSEATAPISVPFAQYGDKAVLVIDKDDPDEGAVRLAYIWSRWVAKRKLGEEVESIDTAKIDDQIDEATRSLEHVTHMKKFHTQAKDRIEDASTHLESMAREIKSALKAIRDAITTSE
jgi:hypothetical protein